MHPCADSRASAFSMSRRHWSSSCKASTKIRSYSAQPRPAAKNLSEVMWNVAGARGSTLCRTGAITAAKFSPSATPSSR